MTDEEIKDGNKLIATFMNVPLTETGMQHNERFVVPRRFHYHEDWNELMPVVDKIEQHQFNDCKEEYCLSESAYLRTFSSVVGVRINRYGLCQQGTRILSTWAACVNFILHQNTLKQ